eukprot:scaffold90708_cov26-Tisochrysis_lutea.AAC.1
MGGIMCGQLLDSGPVDLREDTGCKCARMGIIVVHEDEDVWAAVLQGYSLTNAALSYAWVLWTAPVWPVTLGSVCLGSDASVVLKNMCLGGDAQEQCLKACA